MRCSAKLGYTFQAEIYKYVRKCQIIKQACYINISELKETACDTKFSWNVDLDLWSHTSLFVVQNQRRSFIRHVIGYATRYCQKLNSYRVVI